MLFPLHLSQPTTAPFLSSACFTTKQPPGSSMNSTLPLSTTLMFKTSFKRDLTMSGRFAQGGHHAEVQTGGVLGANTAETWLQRISAAATSTHLPFSSCLLLSTLVHAKNTHLGPVPVINSQHDIA